MADEKKYKLQNIRTYADKLGLNYVYVSTVGDMLLAAHEDGVTNLLMSRADFAIVKKYLCATGIAGWNWDGKTVWGMSLDIDDI